MAVGGNDGGSSKTVNILSLDGLWKNSDCVAHIVKEFPAKIEGAMGATIGIDL